MANDGPIVWGIAGFFLGAAWGLLLDKILNKKEFSNELKKGKGGEIVLIIHCHAEKVDTIKNILFENFTLGVSVVDCNKKKNLS